MSRPGALRFLELGQHECHRRTTCQIDCDGHRGTSIRLVRLIKVVGSTWHHLLEEERKLLGVEHAIFVGVETVENRPKVLVVELILAASKSRTGASLILAYSEEAFKCR